MWEAINQYTEKTGASVRVVVTIRQVDDVTGDIIGQRTISAVTGENNPNLRDVILNQLLQEADKAKAEILREKEIKDMIPDLMTDIADHLNNT